MLKRFLGWLKRGFAVCPNCGLRYGDKDECGFMGEW